MWRRGGWKLLELFAIAAVVGAASLACPAFTSLASAQSGTEPADGTQASSNYGWREVYGGVDAARDQWLVYSGMTVAPWSRNIYSDGWRLRIGGGYGQYSYDRDVIVDPACGTPLSPACTYEAKRFKVARSYGEALLGYYLQLGALTAKAFAGAALSSNRSSPPDTENTYLGTAVGGKAALELWYNIGEHSWTSLDASFATSHNETSARWRAGWLLTPQLSFGPELRYDNNLDSGGSNWSGRAGGFARYQWENGEISIAGGTMRQIESAGAACGPYGTLNVLFQY